MCKGGNEGGSLSATSSLGFSWVSQTFLKSDTLGFLTFARSLSALELLGGIPSVVSSALSPSSCFRLPSKTSFSSFCFCRYLSKASLSCRVVGDKGTSSLVAGDDNCFCISSFVLSLSDRVASVKSCCSTMGSSHFL